MKAIAKLLTGEHITAMVKALHSTGFFTVEQTHETVIAKHTASGKEVYRALKKGAEDAWIVRHHAKLFN